MSSPNHQLVSVIIPFLNGGAWLAEAIDSVLQQSYTHWEAILVDDGSAEEAGDIAKAYSQKYPDKIVYADHPGHANKGVTVSRNLGIRLSKGSIIAFLDADDCWLPDKLLYQLSLFEQYPTAAMICEASLFWYSWSDRAVTDVIVKVGAQPEQLYNPGELIKNLYPLGKGAPPCPTGIMIKREAFDRSGGFEEAFTGEFQLYEDQAFLSKIYLRESVYISGTANNRYRKRSGSLTGSGSDEQHYKKVRLFFLDWLQQYLHQQHIEDLAIFQLITAAKTALYTNT